MDLRKLSDLTIIAATICQEAGGEEYAGQMMVGQVIVNRSKASGKSLRDVCLEPHQFSAWNNKGEMWLRMQTMRKHPAWPACAEIVRQISQPGYKPASTATHYYAFKKIRMPAWAESMKLVAVVGGHYFMREAI